VPFFVVGIDPHHIARAASSLSVRQFGRLHGYLQFRLEAADSGPSRATRPASARSCTTVSSSKSVPAFGDSSYLSRELRFAPQRRSRHRHVRFQRAVRGAQLDDLPSLAAKTESNSSRA